MATEYGLQLFSLRDITGNDLEGALKAVAEMGYKYVSTRASSDTPPSRSRSGRTSTV